MVRYRLYRFPSSTKVTTQTIGSGEAMQESDCVTDTMSRRWHVAQTHIHAELKATQHLKRQGFEVYLPRYLKRRRHARRVETVAAPPVPPLPVCRRHPHAALAFDSFDHWDNKTGRQR